MPEEIDHIAELEKRLYARDPDAVPQRKYGILRPLRNKTESSWGENDLPKEKQPHHTRVSPIKRLFVGSFIFFLIGVGVAVFSIYRGAIVLSSKNVELSILGNSFVDGGETLPLQIDIVNKNSSALTEATLTLSYPRGASMLPADLERVRKDIGVIGSGKTRTESFSAVLYGEQGTSRDITATLEYKLEGSSAVFVKEKTISVMINTSPVALSVDAPSTTASNQPFTMNVRTVSTGNTTLNDTVLRVEYPNGFSFLSASPEPTAGNNTWDLKDMEQGTERIVSIRGKLVGEEQDEKSFRVYVGKRTSETDPRISVSYNAALHSAVIAQPFITATISFGNESGDVVALPYGSQISGTVNWKNNTALDITKPIFTLDILSEDVDPNSLVVQNGYYDALAHSIVWDSESDPDLATISPGDSAVMPFSFSVKKEGTLLKEVALSLSVKGTFPQRDFFEDGINSIDQKTVRFASRLQFATQALFSVGPIKNTGPFPSRVDKETTYTILWTMRPVENPLTKARAYAVLPPGIVWAGVISPDSEVVSYDPEKRLVTWSIGSLPKTTPTPQVRSVAFQVKVKPTRSQLDSDIVLLDTTTVEATDTVANAPLSITRPEVTNRLSTDPLYSPGKEKVLP